DLGGPFAAGIDDTPAEAVFDLDPPALAFELRHGVVNKARPVASPIGKPEGNSTAVCTGRAERVEVAQAERFQSILRPPLGARAADTDPTILDPAQLARRVIGIYQAAAIDIAEQCDIDLLVPILPPVFPIIPAALAIGEQQGRDGRLIPDFLDQVGSRSRQG